MKYPRLTGSISILGIVIVAMYFTFFSWDGAFFGLMLPCYVIIGIIEMNINEMGSMIKHFKLFRFVTLLGAVFVTSFTVVFYLSATTDLIEILSSVSSGFFLPLLYTVLMLFLLIGGTVFLTVGILKIGTQYFKNHRNLFAVPAAISVPPFIFALIYLVMSSIPPSVAF